MLMRFSPPVLITVTALTLGAAAAIATAAMDITQNSNHRCITGTGLHHHTTGTVSNPNTPHAFTAQKGEVCVTTTPEKGDRARPVRVPGIAKNGIKIRPGTAEFYDPTSPRGHSRNRSSGWNLDGMGARDTLGLDAQNAHVGPEGEYHYHAMPPALIGTPGNTLVGWAADGFEIHYIGAAARPAYVLLPGTRQTAPGGLHDGTYTQDWTYVQGAGNLDQCNGGVIDGHYVYFATDTYPFFPRCLYGTDITRIR